MGVRAKYTDDGIPIYHELYVSAMKSHQREMESESRDRKKSGWFVLIGAAIGWLVDAGFNTYFTSALLITVGISLIAVSSGPREKADSIQEQLEHMRDSMGLDIEGE